MVHVSYIVRNLCDEVNFAESNSTNTAHITMDKLLSCTAIISISEALLPTCAGVFVVAGLIMTSSPLILFTITT